MAKNKKEIRYADMQIDELNRQVQKSKDELFKLQFRAVTAPVKNTMQIRNLKRDIARCLTFINQRSKRG